MNRWILLLLWITVITYYAFTVYLNNDYATQGDDLYSLQQELQRTKLENGRLYNEILHNRALGTIEAKAYKSGMVEGEILYLYDK